MDNFGGIIQFLPFLNIINGIYNNKNITLIDNKEKKDVLIEFSKTILLVIYKYVKNTSNELYKQLQKTSYKLVSTLLPIYFFIHLY